MTATILVIEDDEASRQLVSYLLEAAGHRVLLAENGAQGLGMALAEAPDLILCDLQMPVMNGYEVAQSLRSHHEWRAVPLIAVTAFSMPGDRERALELLKYVKEDNTGDMPRRLCTPTGLPGVG